MGEIVLSGYFWQGDRKKAPPDTRIGKDFPPLWQAKFKVFSVLLLDLGCVECTPASWRRREVAVQAEGYPHPWNGVERAERSGGLHKRSADDWGDGLYAREGRALLGIKEELAPYRTGSCRGVQGIVGEISLDVGTNSSGESELFLDCPSS